MHNAHGCPRLAPLGGHITAFIDAHAAALASTLTPCCVPTHQVSIAFDAMDVNGSGSLDYEEFVAVLSGVSSPFKSEAA